MSTSGCDTFTNNRLIKVSEPKSRKATFSNPESATYCITRFDGCVVFQQTACDFILEKVGVGRVLVELKGRDVSHGTSQIEAGLQYLVNCGRADLPAAGLIVCSQYPRSSSTVQRLQQRVKKRFRAKLHVTAKAQSLAFDSLL